MKRIFTILGFLIFSLNIFAQAPARMSFQTIVRNSGNKLITASSVGMKISILQGSPTGAAVYVETQTALTNYNGLAIIEIGSGSVVSGNFSNINWSAGLYYVKTETDPAGGTNYSVVSTAQLLTVPYAFYATSAGSSFSGNYNDLTNKPVLFDSLWTSIKGKPVFAKVAITGSYTDLVNKPVFSTVATTGSYTDLLNRPKLFDSLWTSLKGKPANIVNVSFTPGSGLIIFYNGTKWDSIPKGSNGQILTMDTNAPKWKTLKSSSGTHRLGESFGGGIVAYVDSTGSHGFIISSVDVSAGTAWSNVTATLIGASAQSLWDGFSNCSAITAQSGHTTSAALLSRIYMGGGYSDWYLPGIDQLIKILLAKYELDKVFGANVLNNIYWSSTEFSATNVFAFSFQTGSFFNNAKNNSYRIRAVRNF